MAFGKVRGSVAPDRRVHRPSLRIVTLYAAFAAAWILFSDAALFYLVRDPGRVAAISAGKGWFFVLVTSLLLWSLVAGELAGRARLEAELRGRLDEKKVLLREVHHRVKNNLQVVASILSLERDLMESEADRGILDETRERVRSMGLVHGSLAQLGDLARVDLGAWLETLVPDLADSLGIRGRLGLDLGHVELDMDRALPCGLVVAEALSNAARHGGDSPVMLSLRALPEGRVELEVRDSGPGFPAPGAEASKAGIGLLLATALASQIGGRLERRNEGGAVLILGFDAAGRESPRAG